MKTLRFSKRIFLLLLLGGTIFFGLIFSIQQFFLNNKGNESLKSGEIKESRSIIKKLISEITNNSISESISITFIGDIMVDRYIRKAAEKTSYNDLFDSVRSELLEKDLVIGNLEGPITNYQSLYSQEGEFPGYTFTFDPKILEGLFDSNIKMVFLDNNHIYNFGAEGLNQTINYLNNKKISYFGNPKDRSNLTKNIDGISLTFISYNEFVLPNFEQTIKNIKVANDFSNYVVVFAHWGDEYQKTPNFEQINLAHKFVDNGADIVIGTHPHVIQSKEIYKNRYIYYSLGNFIFDQYFNEDVRCGAVITFNLDKDNIISVEEEFVYLDKNNIVSFEDCRDSIDLISA